MSRRVLVKNLAHDRRQAGAQEKSTTKRLLAVLTEEQRRWKSLAGEPVTYVIVPFGSPGGTQ